MATTSTLPAVKAQLVSRLTTLLATTGVGGTPIPVTYAWPGTDARHEAVYLGRHPEFVANPLAATGTIKADLASIKAGRKYRDESYDIEATIWSFRPELDAKDAATAEARAFVILGVLEDLLADTPQIGLTTIRHAVLGDVGAALVPFETGWASVLIPSITVTARLT